MKTFGQLTKPQREIAVERAEQILLAHLVEGVIQITFPNRKTQEIFHDVMAQARNHESMMMAHKLVWENATLQKEVKRIARAAAEGSRYNDDGFILMDIN